MTEKYDFVVYAAVFATNASEMPLLPGEQNSQPNYNLEDRIRSFPKNWPYNGLRNAQEMAKAGLFYGNNSEKKDEVRCFSCGATIWNWEPNDIPLNEHVKIARKECEFLKNEFGEAQINEIIKSFDQKDEDESMKNMREMGYTKTEIIHAMEHIQKSGGLNEKSVDEAVEKAKKGKEGAVNICIHCKQEERQVYFLPCQHTVSCYRCSYETGKCFVCDKEIVERMRIYMA